MVQFVAVSQGGAASSVQLRFDKTAPPPMLNIPAAGVIKIEDDGRARAKCRLHKRVCRTASFSFSPFMFYMVF